MAFDENPDPTATPAPEVTGGTDSGGGGAPAAPAPAPAERADTFDAPKPSGKSIREHLQNAFRDAQRETEPTPQPTHEPDGTTGAPEVSTSGRPRGPDGKFLSAQPAAPTPVAAAEPVTPTAPAKAAPAPQTAERVPPGGWSAEAKQAWPTLSPAIQDAVLKRETEVSDGFKGKSESEKKLQERLTAVEPYAKVFEPHAEWFARNGRSGPEVAARAMEWIWSLAQPDRAEAKRVYDNLGRAFNIPASQQPAAPAADASTPAPGTNGTASATASDVEARVARMLDERLNPIQQAITTQTQQQIMDHITSWSVDKPYYERVKSKMGQLIGNNLVPPLPNGKADLDTAYQQVIWSDPEIRKELMAAETKKLQDAADQKAAELKAASDAAAAEAQRAQEAQAKAAAEAKAKADAAAHRQAHATQARTAGVSVGTRAPTAAPSPPARRAGTPPREVPSVRDRLMEALKQHA